MEKRWDSKCHTHTFLHIETDVWKSVDGWRGKRKRKKNLQFFIVDVRRLKSAAICLCSRGVTMATPHGVELRAELLVLPAQLFHPKHTNTDAHTSGSLQRTALQWKHPSAHIWIHAADKHTQVFFLASFQHAQKVVQELRIASSCLPLISLQWSSVSVCICLLCLEFHTPQAPPISAPSWRAGFSTTH